MKKTLLILGIVLLILLTGCSESNETATASITTESGETTVTNDLPDPTPTDVWNGSTAKKFEGGSGSSADPYRISTVSQLAYLSQTVNAGTPYANKHFVLESDLDLNNKEWTPIGNGKTSFQGVFDGNNHSIYNLKITKATEWTNPSSDAVWGIAGLFGTCENASLYNFKIENASISINPDKNDYDYVGIGTIVGRAMSTSQFQFNNIHVNESLVKINESTAIVYEGGLIGYLQVNENSWCTLSVLQSTSTLTSNGEYLNYLGGIIGFISNYGVSDLSDLASYTTVKWPFDCGKNYAGAISSINSVGGNTELANIFAEIQVNREPNMTASTHLGQYSFKSNAIVGIAYQDQDQPGSFKCKNLFGYVTKSNSVSRLSLYEIWENLIESNCKACASLPNNHNFNTAVWDVSSASHPILK